MINSLVELEALKICLVRLVGACHTNLNVLLLYSIYLAGKNEQAKGREISDNN